MNKIEGGKRNKSIIYLFLTNKGWICRPKESHCPDRITLLFGGHRRRYTSGWNCEKEIWRKVNNFAVQLASPADDFTFHLFHEHLQAQRATLKRIVEDGFLNGHNCNRTTPYEKFWQRTRSEMLVKHEFPQNGCSEERQVDSICTPNSSESFKLKFLRRFFQLDMLWLTFNYICQTVEVSKN